VFIKRIVAVAGDVVEVKNGLTFVNDTVLDWAPPKGPAERPNYTMPPVVCALLVMKYAKEMKKNHIK
jgi:hypothetical protein